MTVVDDVSRATRCPTHRHRDLAALSGVSDSAAELVVPLAHPTTQA